MISNASMIGDMRDSRNVSLSSEFSSFNVKIVNQSARYCFQLALQLLTL